MAKKTNDSAQFQPLQRMLNEHLDASSAAFRVGYGSPSQFSREYSRLYGAPPKRDIDQLRRQAKAEGAPQ